MLSISRRRIYCLLTIALLFLGLYLLRVRVLTGIGELLVSYDPPQKAEMIFLLNGEINTRPSAAARLFHQEMAPVVVVARSEEALDSQLGLVPHSTDLNVALLQKLGVPSAAVVQIRTPGGVSSTHEELTVLRQYMQQHKVRSVIVVTSETHSRRTRWLLSRVMAGLPVQYRMAPVPDRHFTTSNWWQTEEGLISVVNEYLKFVHNAVFR